jgi:hypothetical protein
MSRVGASGVEIIEELAPLRDLRMALRLPRAIKSVRLVT